MLDCGDILKLAERFAPIMRYAQGAQPESFFPVEAESWLTHCSPDDHTAPGTRKRGTALYKYVWDPNDPNNEPWIGSIPLVSCQGAGPAENRKCSGLSLDPEQKERYIGSEGLRCNPDYFVNFGGWLSPPNAQSGDMEYLREVFTNLMGGPPGQPDPKPAFCFPSQGPAWYAELAWAAALAKTSEREKETGEPNPLAPARDLLAPYLALTFHMLYPAMERALGESAAKNREGQWEAITIFLKDHQLHRDPAEVTPRDFLPGELLPMFVAYSRSYTAGGSPRQVVRPWPERTRGGDPSVEVVDGTHPVAWVTLGTHKNMWKQLSVPVTIPEEVPNPGLLIAGGALLGVAAAAAGYCALYCLGSAPGGPIPWLSCALCWAIVGAIALIALLLLLFAYLCKSRRERSENRAAEDPLPVGNEQDLFNGNGPSGGALPGTPGAPPDAKAFILRVVDRLNGIPETPAYPPPRLACENPVWWQFGGRWGVQITSRTPGLDWDSGTRLTDANCRSRAYHNALALVQFTQTTDPAQRGASEEPGGTADVPRGEYQL